MSPCVGQGNRLVSWVAFVLRVFTGVLNSSSTSKSKQDKVRKTTKHAVFQTPEGHEILDKTPFLWIINQTVQALGCQAKQDTIDAKSVPRQNDLKPTNNCFKKNKSTLVI